jgi:hypothetical protein
MGISILVSCFDTAIVMDNKFASLWQMMIVFPGNICAWLVNLWVTGQLGVTSAVREFALTLPFNLMWFSAWAWMANTIIDALAGKQISN